ncbi:MULTISPECIES: hypothetical protein [unclassified Brucella]|uniref:hypothetical protein n=1 Tax=unclassified Brucella TaxID=2632610 RepID=UPI0012ADE01E|nr:MULTISPECIES: hypothetical protein [unclassified Brucella]MRN79473.1 hypothetical protein [Brucella sp. 10RB9210]UWF59792.1 hypothetical protein NYO66_04585 [Brucella sp. 2716]
MIKNILETLFPKPTTDRALAGMSKALDQLQAVVDHEEEEIDRLDLAIEDAARERLDAFKRRDRAQKVADRFADLIA